MSIAQDGSNTKKKMMTRLIVLGVITAILAVGIVYALHALNKKGHTMSNYIRGYSTSAEANTVKELVADPDSHVWFAKFRIDKSFKKCTVIVDRYHFGKLESSEEIGSTEYMEDTDRSGIAAVVFNTDKNEYRVAVADGGGTMSFDGLSLTGEEGPMPQEDMMISSSPMGDDPVKVTKGKAIPIAACNMGTGDQLAGYSPEYYEEMRDTPDSVSFKDANDYALVIKLRFD